MNYNRLKYNVIDSDIRFKFHEGTIELLNTVQYKFGFDGSEFGKVVYYRTYSRKKSDGSQENWIDTVVRVIEGIFTIRKWWYVVHNLPWDEIKIQKIARNMAVSMIKMHWLPPGRGLWIMGTDYIYERGSLSLYNCCYTEVNDLVKDTAWLMQALMSGCGVGFGSNKLDLKLHKPEGTEIYTIPDSREGWVDSVSKLIDSYVKKSKEPIFDYSLIRHYGEPIYGFGGTASGPEPLMELHGRIKQYLEDYLNNKINDTLLIANIENAVGCCVSAGNVRRSAEINIGSIDDETFMNLKNYDIYPDRANIGWMSNNTVRLEIPEHFEKLPLIAKSVLQRGEPAVANMINIKKYGRIRMGDSNPDKATGMNPCGEIPLEDKEVCNLSEVFPTRCDSKEEFFKALRYATVYASTVSLYPTSSPETNVIVSRNRRIGISLSGIADWVSKYGNAKCIRWLREGYKIVKECNKITNEEAGVPPSIRLTCVKPSGTISQLVGCSPGMHHPTSTYAIRRVIIDKTHPVVPLLIEANYRFEPQIKYVNECDLSPRETIMEKYLNNSAMGNFVPIENDNTYVFEFPIYLGKSRPANTVSAWEQFSQLAMLQREWADNSVSCTVYFNPETEKDQLELMLAQFVPLIKSVSMLPLKDSSIYPQVPYQEITEEQYNDRVKELYPIDWSRYSGSDGINELYCSNDTCTI